jgi:lipopolysaccharide export system ATP-binding protein
VWRVLLVQHIAKNYDDYSFIGDVSLCLLPSEVVALLGPSGAGKSTIFRLLIGLLRPDAGDIYLDDVNITDYPVYERARRGLSYLPQEPSVIPNLTVEQNLLFSLEIHGPNSARVRIVVDELLTIFGLQHVRSTRAGKVSGGERRRCEIARTMANGPKFVLLDEPFAGLDPLAVADMMATIVLLKKNGVGILITDHNIRDTLSFVDRAYIMRSGRIIKEGSADEVIADPEVRRTYLGSKFSL